MCQNPWLSSFLTKESLQFFLKTVSNCFIIGCALALWSAYYSIFACFTNSDHLRYINCSFLSCKDDIMRSLSTVYRIISRICETDDLKRTWRKFNRLSFSIICTRWSPVYWVSFTLLEWATIRKVERLIEYPMSFSDLCKIRGSLWVSVSRYTWKRKQNAAEHGQVFWETTL